jgi:hypothetical protein
VVWRKRALLLGSPVALAAFVLAACSIYDPSLLAPLPDAAPVADAGPEGATPDADTCAHATAPAPPAADDGTANLDLVFAADSLQLLEAKTPLGLDLDHVCTCPGPEACRSVSTPTKVHCDDDAGRDNSGGQTIATFSSVSDTFNETLVNQRIRSGASSILLRVRGYNGGANDTSVTAILYKSTGIQPIDDAGTTMAPRFDGTDRWQLDPGSIVGGGTATGVDCDGNPQCIALTFDQKAYVTDHVLVMRINVVLPLGAGTQLDLTNATVTGRLAPMGNSFTVVDGNIAGRWKANKVLEIVGNAKSPAGPGLLCNDLATYQQIKQLVCGAADLPSDPSQDRTDVACDALSLGLAFTASPARLGTVAPVSTDAPPCGAFTDTCK